MVCTCHHFWYWHWRDWSEFNAYRKEHGHFRVDDATVFLDVLYQHANLQAWFACNGVVTVDNTLHWFTICCHLHHYQSPTWFLVEWHPIHLCLCSWRFYIYSDVWLRHWLNKILIVKGHQVKTKNPLYPVLIVPSYQDSVFHINGRLSK